MKEKIKIGMSSCLLGEEVRWDADHKHDQYVRDVLGSYFDYVSICPEVDVGMGVPRETVALYGTLENPKMITKRSKTDWTKKMNHYTKDRIHDRRAMGRARGGGRSPQRRRRCLRDPNPGHGPLSG